MGDWEDRHPPNPDGTIDITITTCGKCGMTMPDVAIYTEQHAYKCGTGAVVVDNDNGVAAMNSGCGIATQPDPTKRPRFVEPEK